MQDLCCLQVTEKESATLGRNTAVIKICPVTNTLFDFSRTLKLLTLMLKQELTYWNVLCKDMSNLAFICRKMICVKIALVLIKYISRWCIIIQESLITLKHVHMIPSGNNLIHLCMQKTESLVVQFKCTKLSTAKTNQISVHQFNSFWIWTI